MEVLDIFVDGGFKNEKATWAFIVVDEHGNIIHQQKGSLEGKINSMRQIGGELKAAAEAVKYCRSIKKTARIFYDYYGIYKWIADIFNEKPWGAKNEFTQNYRQFMVSNRRWIHEMVKVKSHSGNKFNDLVDTLV